MYLSRLKKESINQDSLHRVIMRAFPSINSKTPRLKAGVLHRVDGNFVLVQSKVLPTWKYMFKPDDYDVKEYTIPDIQEDQAFAFRLSFNPVKRYKGGESTADPIKWLASREPQIGASFDVKTITKRIISESSKQSYFRINSAIADGLLTVTDPLALKESIENGIGRSRAYGCGLLSIAAIQI